MAKNTSRKKSADNMSKKNGKKITNFGDFILELNELFISIKEGKTSLKKATELNKTANNIIRASALGVCIQRKLFEEDKSNYLSLTNSS